MSLLTDKVRGNSDARGFAIPNAAAFYPGLGRGLPEGGFNEGQLPEFSRA
jgi:hypothetical protein